MSTPKKEHDSILARKLTPETKNLLREARQRLRQKQRREWANANLNQQQEPLHHGSGKLPPIN